jgi:hypothetical protein
MKTAMESMAIQNRKYVVADERFVSGIPLLLAVLTLTLLATGRSGLADARNSLAAMLRDGDAAVRTAGVAEIRNQLRSDPLHAPTQLRDEWMKPLLAAKMYPEADDLALAAILARPRVSPLVASLQKSRVTALTASGRKEEALAAAKSYYNVAMMRDTKESIVLLRNALAAARGDAVAEHFISEQADGANAAAGSATRPISSVLASVKVDAGPYKKAIAARQTGKSYDLLVERGNLLLLADRTPEAEAAFAEAFDIATQGRETLAAAIENHARAMRAADGTVARANAWIISLRSGDK